MIGGFSLAIEIIYFFMHMAASDPTVSDLIEPQKYIVLNSQATNRTKIESSHHPHPP